MMWILITLGVISTIAIIIVIIAVISFRDIKDHLNDYDHWKGNYR